MKASERYRQLRLWLERVLPGAVTDPGNTLGDASTRRYFRALVGDVSYVVMDAPPGLQPVQPFISMAAALACRGLQVPAILAADVEQGFLLLNDFGDRTYLHVLTECRDDRSCVDRLYCDAMQALLRIQRCPSTQRPLLETYDEALLRRELAIFEQWYCDAYLGLTLDCSEQRVWQSLSDLLCASALAQPRVWVHRDFHSRNLMLLPDNNPGVLDFQDGLYGPLTYDLVSLLRDCYIDWPESQVRRWAAAYYRQLAGLPELPDWPVYWRWFELMGVQRHLKAVGIFARLHLRDGKSGYLQDIPRTLSYIQAVAGRYAELQPLQQLLASRLSDTLL